MAGRISAALLGFALSRHPEEILTEPFRWSSSCRAQFNVNPASAVRAPLLSRILQSLSHPHRHSLIHQLLLSARRSFLDILDQQLAELSPLLHAHIHDLKRHILGPIISHQRRRLQVAHPHLHS